MLKAAGEVAKDRADRLTMRALLETHHEPVGMTEEEFKSLPEYSCSMPTGVFPGKQWKRNTGWGYDFACWWRLEFVADVESTDGACYTVWRPIYIL